MINPTSSPLKIDSLRLLHYQRQNFSLYPLRSEADSVLLVDEDEETRFRCRQILASAGVGVIEADSFFKAFNLLKVHSRPKAIVMDYWVGGHTTEEFITLLESKKSILQKVPLVLMSHHEKLKKQAARLGVRHFLCKPIHAESLIAAVNSLEPH